MCPRLTLPLLTSLLAAPTLAQTRSQPATQPAPTQAAATQPAASPPTRRFHLLFTSDIYGRFAWPGCNGRPTRPRADLARLVTAVQRRRQEARQAGEGSVMVAGGSMLRPDVMGNHIFGEGQAWAGAAIQLMRQVGFDAVSVGPHDFGAQPDVLSSYMTRMSGAHLPLLAANVSCADAADFRCRHLGRPVTRGGVRAPYVVVQREGVRVGIFAVVRQDLVSRNLGRSAGSLKVSDPVERARELVRRLRRQEQVDLVVVLANLNLESNAPEPVLTFVRKLERDDAPDLVLADSMFYRKSRDFITRIQNRVGPTILGTDRFGQHLGHAIVEYHRERSGGASPECGAERARCDRERSGGASPECGAERARCDRARLVLEQVRVEMQPVADVPPQRQAVRLVGDLRAELCRALDQPLGRAHVKGAMTQDDFMDYTMEVMRNRVGAEIALLNESAVADTSFPMSGRMTREKILRALRTETQLGTFRMTGTRLKKVLLSHLGHPSSGLSVRGLVKDGTKWYVNSRPLMDGQHYKVAVTRFVASGGDELVTLLAERFVDSGFTLRRVVTDFFDTDRQAALDNDPSIDVSSDFPDPWSRWVLYGETNVGVSVSDTSVDNYDAGRGSTRYNQPLLTRDDVTALKVDVGIGLGASNRNHTMELDLSLQYGQTWTLTAQEQAEGKDSTGAETLDKIRADFLYRLNMIRNRRAPGRWYLPVPYAEATMITEFTPDATYCTGRCGGDSTDDELETYRYLELGGTLGIGFLLHPNLFAKAGFAVSGELLTPREALEQIGQEREAHTGIYLGYKLRRVKLISSVHHPLQLESRLDFFFTDLGQSLRRELTVQTKVYFSLTPILHISAGHTVYYFDTRDRQRSWANDISLGLDLLLDYRHQLF